MTLIRPSLDYTAKDFDSLRDRLFNIIPSAFPDWTDLQVANFGNLLVEMFAFTGDVLSYYQDNQASESRWSTALLRRSMLSLAKMIGFQAIGASAATATVTVRLTAIPTGSVTFAAGDMFTTADVVEPIEFQVLIGAVIAAGTDPPAAFITVENSTPWQELFQSSGLANQTFILSGQPFLSLQAIAADGPYAAVPDFLNSTSIDRHMTVTVDENARACVTFGNGVAGSVPTGTITFDYKVGGGAVGNVGPNTITKVRASYTDSLGNPVSARATNVAKASGGSDGQTVEGMREAGPRSLRALTRTVTREDYELNALRVPGVARALMMSRDEKPSVQENQGQLFIVPAGGGVPTQALLNRVTQMIAVTYPKTITFKLTVFPATYLPINISVKVRLVKGAVGAAVAPIIRTALAEFFRITAADGSNNGNVDFGYYLDGVVAWSDIFNCVRDARGVREIDPGLGNLVLNGATSDVVVAQQQFPTLGTVQLINVVTGGLL